jgi:16S rRNA (uracil1498-N3)-methyltransferase
MRDYRHFLFFTERVDTDRLVLDAAETHHCVTVLRLSKGDPFMATDGRGTIYECKLDAVIKGELSGTIVCRSAVPRHPCTLHMLIGLPQRDSFEAIVTDLTALGVARITPLICKYCQEPWWAGATQWKKIAARFQSKMIASLKQARYPYIPILDAPLPFQQALSTAAFSSLRIVADPHGIPFSGLFDTVRNHHSSLVGIIGPPGGLAPEESAALTSLGAREVRLVPTRLTTELAAVVLCSQILASALPQEGTPAAPTPSPGAAA